MKAKLIILLVVAAFVFSSVTFSQAQTDSSIWRDDMNYQNREDLETAGWTTTHQAGISFSGNAIILDGTSQDTAIHYSNHFSAGVSDWKVEDRSRWTLGSHCGNSVTAVTNKHSYSFMADGWYGNFVFYRDGQKTTFGNYQENKNEWFTLAIEKQGDQINMYYNNEIKSTYTETDNSPSQLIGADAVSPWKGGSEYDYFEVWSIENAGTPEAQTSLLSNPIVIGGIIGAVGVGVAGVLYFFVFSGGEAAGSAAGNAGATGSVGGSQGGGGSNAGGDEHGSVLHPAGGGTLIHQPGNVGGIQASTVGQSQSDAPVQGLQNTTNQNQAATSDFDNTIPTEPTELNIEEQPPEQKPPSFFEQVQHWFQGLFGGEE